MSERMLPDQAPEYPGPVDETPLAPGVDLAAWQSIFGPLLLDALAVGARAFGCIVRLDPTRPLRCQACAEETRFVLSTLPSVAVPLCIRCLRRLDEEAT